MCYKLPCNTHFIRNLWLPCIISNAIPILRMYYKLYTLRKYLCEALELQLNFHFHGVTRRFTAQWSRTETWIKPFKSHWIKWYQSQYDTPENCINPIRVKDIHSVPTHCIYSIVKKPMQFFSPTILRLDSFKKGYRKNNFFYFFLFLIPFKISKESDFTTFKGSFHSP